MKNNNLHILLLFLILTSNSCNNEKISPVLKIDPINQMEESFKLCVGEYYEKITNDYDFEQRYKPFSEKFVDSYYRSDYYLNFEFDPIYNVIKKYARSLIGSDDKVLVIQGEVSNRFYNLHELLIYDMIYFITKPNGKVRVLFILINDLKENFSEYNWIYQIYDITVDNKSSKFDFFFSEQIGNHFIDSTNMIDDFYQGNCFITSYSQKTCKTDFVHLIYSINNCQPPFKIDNEHKIYLENLDSILKMLKVTEKPRIIFN